MITILNQKLFTKVEVAKMLDVTERYVGNLVNRGRMKHCYIGKRLFISEKSLIDWLNGEMNVIQTDDTIRMEMFRQSLESDSQITENPRPMKSKKMNRRKQEKQETDIN